jgi:hypothetical protein
VDAFAGSPDSPAAGTIDPGPSPTERGTGIALEHFLSLTLGLPSMLLRSCICLASQQVPLHAKVPSLGSRRCWP